MNGIRRYGTRALLLTPAAGGEVLVLADVVRRLHAGHVIDVVPGAETVLVTTVSAAAATELATTLATALESSGATPPAERTVEIPVAYDGPDLEAVARASNLTVDEVVERHTSVEYRCRFCGFAPGFAYLDGLDPALVLPRRPVPRTSVPAGSVAIAGSFAAVYPTASPGGWNLLGRTDAVMWDSRSSDPALVPPGTIVRFRAVDRVDVVAPAPPVPPVASAPALAVTAAGWASTIQDGGRTGLAHLGVPAAGAIDPVRRDQLNRLVGNDAGAAVIETLGGLVLEALTAVVVADSASGAVSALAAGRTLRVDPGPHDTWATLAVRGGIVAPEVLGARSWDSLSQLGPPPLRVGDRLGVGPDPRRPAGELAPPAPSDEPVDVFLGPQAHWFTDDAVATLVEADWVVSSDVSRVGARLAGPALSRTAAAAGRELPSEGIVTGAVQVPPSGQPIVMLADHPTTGGYPVIAVVDERHIARIVRRRPGATVRFRLRTGP